MKWSVLVCSVICAAVCGCTVRYPYKPDGDLRYLNRPLKAPPIVIGQSAKVYTVLPYSVGGWDEITQAWIATGLFKDVTDAKSEVPDPSGVFIYTSCANTTDFHHITGLLVMLTVGLVPRLWSGENTCVTKIYQDGELLIQDSVSMSYQELDDSWFLIADVFRESGWRRQDREVQATTVVAHAITTLSGKQP